MAQDRSQIYPEVIGVLRLPSEYCYVIGHLHSLVPMGISQVKEPFPQ